MDLIAMWSFKIFLFILLLIQLSIRMRKGHFLAYLLLFELVRDLALGFFGKRALLFSGVSHGCSRKSREHLVILEEKSRVGEKVS